MDERRVFMEMIQKEFGNPALLAVGQVGTVVAITSGTLTIRPAVSDTTDASYDIFGMAYLDSYVPAVGDLVQYLNVAGSPYVLGRLRSVAVPHSEGINVAGSTNTTTSGTYVNLSATSSFSFTKGYGHTALIVEMHATYFASVADGTARFGVLIDGVDYDMCQLFHNQINTHKQASGVRKIDGGVVDAGVYTIQGRWRRTGTATLSRDTGDWLSIKVTEEWD